MSTSFYVLGVFIFVFDLIYVVMLYEKFRALGLNPFTRAPAGQAELRAGS